MRVLRITVDWGVVGESCTEEDYDLPEGWDEMSEDRQQQEISEYVEGIVWNRVSSRGEVAEVSE